MQSPSEAKPNRVVIIGAGFSGTMVAVHILNSCPLNTKLTIIESRAELGQGLAYSTRCDEHILNVRAQGMTAFPNDPMHFFDFAHGLDSSVEPQSFVPRKVYSSYIKSILEQSMASAKSRGVSFTVLQNEAIDLEVESRTGEITVSLKDGVSIKADFAVLATGNGLSSIPKIIGSELVNSGIYAHEPWSQKMISAIPKETDVLLIGAGLTAVDKILELLKQGHKGHIYVTSRHGLFPQGHNKFISPEKAENIAIEPLLPTIKSMRNSVSKLSDWRVAVDSVRSVTQQWWKLLSLTEKRRFVRHVQTYWDTHRHRMAPEVAEKIAQAQASGQISIQAGRIQSTALENGLAKVILRKRGDDSTQILQVGKIISCTGPEIKLATIQSELYANMARRGLIKAHPIGFGLEIDEQYHPLNNEGNSLKRIFTLGSVLKAQLMETVAVPELRVQSQNLAQLLLAELI